MMVGFLLLVSAPVQGEEQVSAGQVLAPAFDVTLVGLDTADALAPNAASPAIDIGRNSVILVRDLADATIIGASNGDIGSNAGSPNQAGAVTPPLTIVNGVTIPEYTVTVPPQEIDVATPPVDRTIYVPGINIPPRQYYIPERDVIVQTPPINTPSRTIYLPGVTVNTPGVSTPPVDLGTDPIETNPTPIDVDITGANVQVQSLSGEIFLGSAGSVPYSTPPAQAGEGNLPAGVPRGTTVTVPGVSVPGTSIGYIEGRQWLQPYSFHVLNERQIHIQGREIAPGIHVMTVTVPGATVETPGYSRPGSYHDVHVPGFEIITITTPGESVTSEAIPLTDETLVIPSFSVILNGLQVLDNFGYFGYGYEDDSSMYPYLCGPAVGCVNSDTRLRTWVNYADARLDATAAMVDGALIVTVPGPGTVSIHWPGLPPLYVANTGVSITS